MSNYLFFALTYKISRYENCKRSLQAQLAKNEQSIKDVPSDSVSLKGLHTRLQEIQVHFKCVCIRNR